MSTENFHKRQRLKIEWPNIDIALKIIQSSRQSEKLKYLIESIMKSDLNRFNELLYDNPILVDYPIPVDYKHSNIYQIIVEKSTDTFIKNVFSKYFDVIFNSTEYGKILIPIACDGNILKLILKYFPNASLDDVSRSNQFHNYLLHDKSHHFIQRQLNGYENEIPLSSVIRNDCPDLLSILFQFKSFTFDYLTQQQKSEIFHLCLLAEHRQVTFDQYNIKWFKNQSLSSSGSIQYTLIF